MPEQPYYSYTDSKGDTLEIRKSPNAQPEYGAPEIRVTPPRSSGYREWWYGPRGEKAIEAARVFLDAAGLTDHVIVAPADDGTTLTVPDSPKMLHETLCFATTAVRLHPDQSRAPEHTKRLSRLIAECERHRPLGVDGKHGDLHTVTCGCEDVHYDPAWTPTGPEDDLTLCASTFVGTTGTEHACAQPQGHTTLHRNIAGTACWHNYEADGPAPNEAYELAVRMRGMVHAALNRIADLEEALEEATGLMEDYQTDQAAIRGRLDAVEAQSKGVVHITVVDPTFTEETDG